MKRVLHRLRRDQEHLTDEPPQQRGDQNGGNHYPAQFLEERDHVLTEGQSGGFATLLNPLIERGICGLHRPPWGYFRRALSRHSGRPRSAGVALFLDLGSLAAQPAQVVKLGTAYVTAAVDLDVINDRAMDRKRTFDAHTEADLAYGECLANTFSGTGDHPPAEHLDPGPVSLNDLDRNLDAVPGRKARTSSRSDAE